MKPLVALLAALAVLLPASALAKGPTAAVMEGPGLDSGGVSFAGDEGSGPLGDLTDRSGWFPAVFPQVPNPMLAMRPAGDLGSRYDVTYTVPGPDGDTFTIRQAIYPYAANGPVTYLAAGQRIFDTQTNGGWFQAGPDLTETLVAAGLPESPPQASPGGRTFPTLSVLAIVLFAGVATFFLVGRRARPSPA